MPDQVNEITHLAETQITGQDEASPGSPVDVATASPPPVGSTVLYGKDYGSARPTDETARGGCLR